MAAINDRLKRFEQLLQTLESNTQPIEGHTDPGSIKDCWTEAAELIVEIESASKLNVWQTWNTAMNGGKNYDETAKMLGTSEFKYTKEDYKLT